MRRCPCTFHRLTLYGKSLIQPPAMPETFAPLEQEPRFVAPAPSPPKPWLPHVAQQGQAKPSVKKADAPCVSPDDFLWTAPFIEKHVNQFFVKHREVYRQSVLDVVNGQMPMNDFSRRFGPTRIAHWINNALKVRDDHPNPCVRQHVDPSPTYQALVKSFKRSPDDHAIVKKLHHGQSEEVQDILDAFLVSGEWDDDPAADQDVEDGT